MNRIQKIVIGLVAVMSSQVYAVKITFKTASVKLISVYVNTYTELDISKATPKAITINSNNITIYAVNESGTITSDFFKVKMPNNTQAIEFEVAESGNSIVFKTTAPQVQLMKE